MPRYIGPVQGLPQNYLVATLETNNRTSNNNAFTQIWGASVAYSTTETNVRIPCAFEMVLKRVWGRAILNGKDQQGTFQFRKNGTGLVTFTNNAGITENFNSGALDITIPANSECTWRVDESASSSGGITIALAALLEIKRF